MLFYDRSCNYASGTYRKSRVERLSTDEAQLSTTKSDGMCQFSVSNKTGSCDPSSVTTRNRLGNSSVPGGATDFSGPIVCATAPPSGNGVIMPMGTRLPNGGRLVSANQRRYTVCGFNPEAAICSKSIKPSELTATVACAPDSPPVPTSCNFAVSAATPGGMRFWVPLPSGTAFGTYTRA